MDKKCKLLILIAITALLVVFCNAAISDFFKDRSISADPATVDAKIVKSEIKKSRSKRGGTRISYDFTYAFEANGKTYRGEFGTSESKAAPYLQSGIAKIMYNKKTPENNDLAANVDTNKTFGDLLIGILLAFVFSTVLGFIIGCVISYKLGWLTKKKAPEASAEAEPAAQQMQNSTKVPLPPGAGNQTGDTQQPSAS